jgi:ribonuclease-3
MSANHSMNRSSKNKPFSQTASLIEKNRAPFDYQLRADFSQAALRAQSVQEIAEVLQNQLVKISAKFSLPQTIRDLSPRLLLLALCHRSFVNEWGKGAKGGDQMTRSNVSLENYERVEFLGDSVLGLVIASKIYQSSIDEHGLPTMDEGHCSKLKDSIVNEEILFQMALLIGIGQLVMLGKGEEKNKGYLRASILSDCLEAIIGVVYLEAGVDAAFQLVHEFCSLYQHKTGRDLFQIDRLEQFDWKTRLQEICLSLWRLTPVYKFEESLKDARPFFEGKVFLGETLLDQTTGRSKRKVAETLAKNCIEKKLYQKYQPGE